MMLMLFSSYFKIEATVALAVALLITQAGAANAVGRSGNLRESNNLLAGREVQAVGCWFDGKSYSVGEEVACWSCEYDFCTCLQDTWGKTYFGNCRNKDAEVQTPAPVLAATPEPSPAPVDPVVDPIPVVNPPDSPIDEGANSCSSNFCETTLTDGYLMRHKFNEPDATITIEVEYDGDAWVGIAFSENARMGDSEAVIGTPDSGLPQKYRLGQGFIAAMSADEQTLTDASVESKDGKTVMKFTKPLVEPNQITISTGENKMLWANGGDITTIGYHGPNNRAPFTLDMSSGSAPVQETPAIVEADPIPEVNPPDSPIDEGANDCSSNFCETTLTDGYLMRHKFNEPDATITIEVEYDGDAWVGIAFSENARMGDSEAVIGSPDSGLPQKYRLGQGFIEAMSAAEQTLTDVSVESRDGKTVMKFTKPLVEPNQITISAGKIQTQMLWANGGDSTTIGYHGPTKGSFSIDLSSGAAVAVGAANKGAWLAHGICAFFAWGIFAPTAVESALFRSLFKGPLWFKVHQFLNSSAYALTVIAFAIAVANVSKGGASHWSTSHAKMGLSMFIIASLQVLGGAVRPHVPAPEQDKTAIRKAWEFQHRLTGVALLACGFWQMSAGIKLFANKFGTEEQGVTIAYWVWICFDIALLLIGGVYFKLLRKNVENGDGNEGEDVVQAEPTTKQKDEAVQSEDMVDAKA